MNALDPAAYITLIDCQSAGSGVLHSLHLPMGSPNRSPSPEPEAEI